MAGRITKTSSPNSKKKRSAIPRRIADPVLKEFRHKCAICGADRPHLHHLDHNPNNNDPLNLLPLCPNCHLRDIHDPTRPPDPAKLKLFRRHKNPLILHPRFHPIFSRLVFFQRALLGDLPPNTYDYYASELVEFVGHFEMGPFYKQKIQAHLSNPARFYGHHLWLQGDKRNLTDAQILVDAELTRKALEHCFGEIETLIVELLRYQDWSIPNRNEA